MRSALVVLLTLTLAAPAWLTASGEGATHDAPAHVPHGFADPQTFSWDWDRIREADTPQKLLVEATGQVGWPAPADYTLDGAPTTLAEALAGLYAARADVLGVPAPDLAPDALPALDPRVEVPVAGMVHALTLSVEHWGRATARLTLADWAAMLEEDQENPRLWDALEKVDQAHMVGGALVLLDASDVYGPAVRAAIKAGAWPEDAFSDPAGLVELGTTGDDHHVQDRWLLIDPAGNDTWNNKAGASGVWEKTVAVCAPGVACLRWPVADPFISVPAALAFDLEGDDVYDSGNRIGQGSATRSIGILRDDAGNDTYSCSSRCQGYGGYVALGLLIEKSGNDTYWNKMDDSMGIGEYRGLGMLYEEAGNDDYDAGGSSKGYGFARGLGIMHDKAGQETHTDYGPGNYGGVSHIPYSGFALYYDTGGDWDDYGPMASYTPYPANDHEWQAAHAPTGRGKDE